MDVATLEALLRCAEAVDEIVLEIDGYEYLISGVEVQPDKGAVIIRGEEAGEFLEEEGAGDDDEEESCAEEGGVCDIPEAVADDTPLDRQA